jgi:hypothetical protein
MDLDYVRRTEWTDAQEERRALIRLLEQGGMTSGERAWVCRRLRRLDNPTARDRVVGRGHTGGLTKEQQREVRLRQKAMEVLQECHKMMEDT